MRSRLASLLLLILGLAACTRSTTTAVVLTNEAILPSPSAPALTPATAGTPATPAVDGSPQPPASPGPTSFAEGLTTRLSTPDPSPNCPDHYPWFFPNQANECAATVLNTWAAFEPFEHGLMIWTQEGGHTYVLSDDGSAFKPYQEVVDLLGQPLPVADPSLSPPDGRYQPVLGFGKFWRGLVPGVDWVRARLGWATAPESDYSALWQCNQATGDAARCYFTGPGDEVIIFARGTAPYWAYWQKAVR